MSEPVRRGKRIQIYLAADLLDRWEKTPRYERSAVVAAALREYWGRLDRSSQIVSDDPAENKDVAER